MMTNNCPICEKEAKLYNIVPLTKNVSNYKPLKYDDRLIKYYQCLKCLFTFCPEMYDWDLTKEIYNEDYTYYDPEYLGIRASRDIEGLKTLFPKYNHLNHLDYGSGLGLLSAKARDLGWKSTAYDPYSSPIRPTGKFNFITAIEVFEHASCVHSMMQDLTSLITREGVILFSTSLITKDTAIDWSYLAPRNGHISLFSTEALKLLATRYFMFFSTLSENVHIMQHNRSDFKRLLHG